MAGDLPPERQVAPMPVAAHREDDGLHFSAADDLLAGADQVRILAGRIARGIRERDGLVEVDVFDRGTAGVETFTARDVVIAAGTIGSAQLIAAAGLDVGPALGAYLIEHVAFGTRIALQEELRTDRAFDEPGFAVWIPASAIHPWSTQITRHFIAYTDVLPPGSDPAQTADLIAFCPVE
ncbi:MAG: hypothetical protein ACREJT_17870, partial [Myxococcota bacterium]